MNSDWKWDQLDPTERRIAELLVQGKSNAAICAELFLSRARVQESIKRIQIKTGADSTRSAIVVLVEERETLSLLRVLDQATDGVAILQDGLFQYVNKSLAEIHGYDDPEEMVGVAFVELIAPGARSTVAERYHLRMQDSPVPRSYVTRILCKGGQEKMVTIASAGLIRYKGKPAVLAIAVIAPEK